MSKDFTTRGAAAMYDLQKVQTKHQVRVAQDIIASLRDDGLIESHPASILLEQLAQLGAELEKDEPDQKTFIACVTLIVTHVRLEHKKG